MQKCESELLFLVKQTLKYSAKFLSSRGINSSVMDGIQAGKKAAAIEAVNNHISVCIYFYFHFEMY